MRTAEILASAQRIVVAIFCFGGVIALGASGWFILFENAPDRTAETDRSRGPAVKDFETAVFGRLYRVHSGSSFAYSPAALRIALLMTRQGSKEDTRSQLNHVLYPMAMDARAEVLAAREHELLELRNGSGSFRVANRLWLEREYDMANPFLVEAQHLFGVMPGLVEFQGKNETAGARVNTWFQERLGPVGALLTAGTVDSLTRFVLTSGAVFQGTWKVSFALDQTELGDFTLASGKTVKAPLMHADGVFRFAETSDSRAVALPSRDGETELLVILPKSEKNPEAFPLALDPRRVSALVSSLKEHKLELTLPRFQIARTISLPPVLSSLGMEDAFDPARADFSGLIGRRELFLNAVVQRTSIAVSEGGSGSDEQSQEGFGALVSSRRYGVFRATRPFIFLLRHIKTNTILIMGYLADPRD